MTPRKQGPQKRARVPERSCVACHTARPKRQLVRIVRTTDGQVLIDSSGKKSGRGAYLCTQPSCWEHGLSRGVLERALKQNIPPECRPALESFAAGLAGVAGSQLPT